MLELMDYVIFTGIYTIILGLAATAYYLDQRAFKVETVSKFEKLMLAWEGRISRVIGKFEGAEAPEVSISSLLLNSILQSEGVQSKISQMIGNLGVSGPGIPPPAEPPKKE